MTDTDRKKVIKKAKNKDNWYTISEAKQDEQIKEACVELGLKYVEFWATDGLKLYKLLS